MARTRPEPDDSDQLPARREERISIANPFGSSTRSDGIAATALVSVEQQRAIAEVQARMIIARANPRDPIRVMDVILEDCTRPSLAEQALYSFARGGSEITGPSIRLMETLARRWGNIAAGIKEIARRDGYSDCVSYAWDLESGYYDERQYQIRHWRDTKGGGYRLTDERDIYELIANMGQRRKRAVLQAVIPGDVIEAACDQCEATLRAKADISADGIKKMLAVFAEFGVTKSQIETRIQRRVESVRPAQMVMLRKIWTSLNDGMSEVRDWFDPNPAQQADADQRGSDADQQQQGSGLQTEPESPGQNDKATESSPREQTKPATAAEQSDAPAAQSRGQSRRRGAGLFAE